MNRWTMFHHGRQLKTPQDVGEQLKNAQDVKEFFKHILLEPAFSKIEVKDIKRHTSSIKRIFGLNGQFEPGMIELEDFERSLDRKKWVWF